MLAHLSGAELGPGMSEVKPVGRYHSRRRNDVGGRRLRCRGENQLPLETPDGEGDMLSPGNRA